jgi:hypothetical protein
MFRKIFHHGKELRAGWRLLIFLRSVLRRRSRNHVAVLTAAPARLSAAAPGDLMIGEGGTLHRRPDRDVDYGWPRTPQPNGVRHPFHPHIVQTILLDGRSLGFSDASAVILLIYLSGRYRIHGLNVASIELLKFAGLWLLANLLIGLSEEITYHGYSCTHWRTESDFGRPR